MLGTRTKMIKIIYDQRLEWASRRRQQWILQGVFGILGLGVLYLIANVALEAGLDLYATVLELVTQWIKKQR